MEVRQNSLTLYDDLKKKAESLLGTEVLQEIKQWYIDTVKTNADYVVYIVRRSYILALIMEKITGMKMQSDKTEFLTDAAMFLQCSKIAEHYRQYGVFPKITLCDDILIHGRNINHFIQNIEKMIIELLPGEDSSVLKDKLADAISIKVYVRADASLLLLGRYENRLQYEFRAKQSVWRELSSNISVLIENSNMANAAYVYTEYRPNSKFMNNKWDDYITTIYQNTKQHAYVELVKSGNFVKAILTVRLIKEENGYRILPFIFLPNLDEASTLRLMMAILSKKGMEKYEKYILALWEIDGKRSFNEFLTFILSNVILQTFNEKYNLTEYAQDSGDEIIKLARNYNLYGFQQTVKMIKEIQETKFFDINELKTLLNENILEEFSILTVENGIWGSPETIRHVLEEYFYKCAYNEEVEAVRLANQLYYDTPLRSVRHTRGCAFTLRELLSGYEEGSIKIGIAYFLQMMDGGVLSVSSYGSQKIYVVGFAEFAKAGEMSLLIEILKFYMYIPLLIMMQRKAEHEGNTLEYEVNQQWKRVIEKQSFACVPKEKVLSFIQMLSEMQQTPEDWRGNYYWKVEFEGEHTQKELFEERKQFIEHQNKLVQDYLLR